MNDPTALIERYVNGAVLRRSDRVWSAIWSTVPFLRNAKQATAASRMLQSQPAGEEQQSFSISSYNGENSFVREMELQLRQQLNDDLLDAMVHGSLGTLDEVSYSDFDALVLLKDEVFENQHRLVRVAKTLHDLRRIMYKMDPLQHHGWFVLTESGLRNFPVLYFPPALFAHSKSLLHERGSNLAIRYSGHHDFRKPLVRLCRSLEQKLSSPLPADLYAIKNLLSEFMLLPALYVQARDRKGMYKKFSFDAARPDFAPASWQAMDVVSSIRSDWDQLLKEGGVSPETIHRDTAMPASLKSRLDAKCIQAMQSLVQEAKEKIK